MSAPVERLIHDGRQLVAHERTGERVRGWPEEAYESIRAINHLTNTGLSIPAPVVYRVLGDLKMAVGALPQALEQMGDGLKRSLESPTIEVTDSKGDPRTSVAEARRRFAQATEHLQRARIALEQAQVAINSQGYEDVEDDQ